MNSIPLNIRSLGIVLGWIASICACHAGPSDKLSFAAEKGIVGTWAGDARPFVTWAKAKEVPASIVVHQDGSVSGKIGDATITEGKVKPGFGRLLRYLGWCTEFIIEAKLDGYLVESEGIHRDSVNIPCHSENGELRGSLISSGWKVGGKETMIFTASLVLRRVATEGTRK